MLYVVIIFAVVSFISLLFMLFLTITAHKGWENENGFDRGRKIPNTHGF